MAEDSNKLLSEKFRNSIRDSKFRDDMISGLYDAVEGMDDEKFREYMYTNRAYFNNNMPVAVDDIPGFKEYVTKEPEFGVRKKIDYEKVTGSPDALDRFYEYSMDDMDYFGSQVGMSGREFMKRMAEDKTNLDRMRIAHGEDEGGWFESPKSFAKNLGGATMNLLAKRSQEAIERGEDPALKDIALDSGENALYAVPWGKVAAKIKNIPLFVDKIKYLRDINNLFQLPQIEKLASALEKSQGIGGKTARFLLSHGQDAVNPAIMEIADAMAYDDNARGRAALGDFLSGTSINVMANRKLGSKLGKLGDFSEPVANWLTNKGGDLLYSDAKIARGLGGATGAAMYLRGIEDALTKEEKLEKRREGRKEADKKYKGKYTREMLEGK